MEHWLDEWIRVIKVKRKKKESIYKTSKFVVCIYVKYEFKKNNLPSRWFEIVHLKLFADH